MYIMYYIRFSTLEADVCIAISSGILKLFQTFGARFKDFNFMKCKMNCNSRTASYYQNPNKTASSIF